MKALITGGAGFIGSHLAELLLADGHRVTVIDNLVTGQAANLEHLAGNPRLEFLQESVLDEERMRALVPAHDVVFHLAAAVGVRWIIENPLQSIRTNVRATEIVLEAAAASRARVLIASTSEVYGKNEKSPLCEDDDSIIGSTRITRWLYANTKATNEFMALAHWWEQRLPVTVVRFFNTVGPRQTGRYGMVVPRFVRQALAGEPLTVYGDGQQSRCFTYVGDAVRALVALLRAPEAETCGEIFNVGNNQPTTIEGLAREVVRRTGSESPLRFVPYDEAYGSGFADMRRRAPDTTKLRRTVGFAPRTPLGEILDRVIAFERAQAAHGAAV